MSRIIERIKETVEKHELIKAGDNIVVGFSGGPDSTCLLHALYTLKDCFGINKIAAVHVNHMYRGEDAFTDEKFSEDFCTERGILFFAYRYDVEQIAADLRISSEDAGRKVRYEAFREVAKEIGGARIAVAHNRQDQAETLLMRIIRGTGTEGLCGIEYRRDEDIIRPLLDCDRVDIEEYCRREKLSPRTDLTNLQPIYTRNVVRLELIPYINELMSCDIVNSLGNLSRIAKEDKDFISGFVEKAMKSFFIENERGIIPAQALRELHPAIKKRVIAKCFSAIGLKNDIGSVHLEKAVEILEGGRSTANIEFPHKYVMKLRYENIYFERAYFAKEEDYFLECSMIDSEPLLSWYVKVKPSKTDKAFQVFDYDKVMSIAEPVLRTRQAGDVISPKGFNGTRKLKEYFIDKKIDRDLRDKIPLLCVGSRVLWIYGIEVNGRFLPDQNTKRLLVAKIKSEMN